MKLSKKIKFELFILLIILNIILRYSILHHETFNDSFEMHILSNSVTEFGEARWWVHPLCVIGMYPSSYTSATSFILSGISQCSSVDVETVIFIYGIIFGIFSIFASYMLAGMLYNDDFFKFLVAFGFSTSQGILTYTTWTASSRSPFIILLPLFLYALLQSRNNPMRFGIVTIVLTVLLLTTHHLVYFLAPLFAAYFVGILIYKLKYHAKAIAIPENLIPFSILLTFCVMAAVPFLTHKFMSIGSKWNALAIMFNEYPRYIGILVFLSFGGFMHLIFKSEKRCVEWIFLTMLIFLTVFIFQVAYMKWFVIIFAILLAGVGFTNLRKLRVTKKKSGTIVIILFMLLSVSFSGYFQFLRTYEDRTINDNEYVSALWIKENIKGMGVGICNSRWTTWKISSISCLPFLTGSSANDQAYGLVDVRDFELEKRPITSEEFWMDSPYKKLKGIVSDGYWQMIMSQYYTSGGYKYIPIFNITYLVEDVRLRGSCLSHHGHVPSPFVEVVRDEKDCLYDSGDIKLWSL